MPYSNEHSARVRDPGDFQPDSFRRKELPKGGVVMILGRLKGETTMTVQAYRFPKDRYTPAEAKQWLKDNDVGDYSFEPAREGSETDDIPEMIKDMSSPTYLEKFRSMLLEWGSFSREQVESIMKIARGHAGGKARVDNLHKEEFQMADGVTPATVKVMGSPDLIQMHRRLHRLWEYANKEEQVGLLRAHKHLVGEMENRSMRHYRRDELDEGEE